MSNGRQGCCVDFATKPGGFCEGKHEAKCMRLPEGKTCGDCVHIYRCTAIGFTSSAQERVCSFHPRRFQEKSG